jgi:hypothetical protein
LDGMNYVRKCFSGKIDHDIDKYTILWDCILQNFESCQNRGCYHPMIIIINSFLE